MTTSLSTQYIDPTTMEPLVASRLIPLDKGESGNFKGEFTESV